ncbi:MAG: type III-A CRISPR-associated protein Cas10/Csm1 [Thermaurantimonas sp.]|uniref:type III-A CRISPR-associated protein Cas10/Csm1 n=1 Tax=Thermaurantimonas sp. TaxID=2681568 RepID=UPI00391CE5E5
MKNATDRDVIYLAALLHDIGKFFQRADPDGMKTSRLIEPEIRKLESVYCPNQGAYYSHLHVLWTAQFIKNHNLEFTVDNLNLMRLACSHHKPGKLDEQLIALADKLSSGMDRVKSNSLDEDNVQTRNNFKKIRLHNVIEYIGRSDDYSGTHRFDILPFKYTADLDASEAKKLAFSKNLESFTNEPGYSKVWQAFSEDIQSIDSKTDFKTWIETFSYVLEKHARFIPSSTVDLPDVSLYDHLRTSAGLAICLYDFIKEKYSNINNVDVKLPDGETPFALLIGADLSGIQSFIYNISSKNAAKSLKGRSFYLQWLIDNVLYCFLNKTGLYRGNVIIDSGGGFHVLAPNTAHVRQTVDELRTTVNEWLFKNFGTRLFISLDYIEITPKNLLQQEDYSIPSLADKWTELHKKLERHKVQRYDKMFISEDAYSEFFEPGIAPKFEDIDDISGDIIEPKNKIGKNRSRQSQMHIELGKQLKNSAGILLAEDIAISPEDKYFEFDFQCSFTRKGVMVENKNGKYYYEGNHVENGRFLTFNSTDLIVPLFGEKNVIKGFTFYGGNTYPSNEEGYPKTFDELAGESDFKRLGILRMDVDNLGALFKNGFSRRKHSISRLATLSRSLDFFFKGYLNNLVQEYKNDCYILYAGAMIYF